MTDEETVEPEAHPFTKGVGDVVRDVLAEHAPVAAEHGARAGAASRKAFLEEMETYNADMLGELITILRSSGKLPPEIDKMLVEIAKPNAQIGGILSSFFLYGVMFQLAGNVLQPFFQAAANAVWEAHPDKPLSPADLATGAVRGILPGGPAITHYPGEIDQIAAESGLDAEDMQFLVDITGMPPSPQDLFEMYRRGIIDMDGIATGLREGDTRDEWIADFQKLAHTWLTPLDFVRAAVQDQLPYSQAETWAGKTGLDTTTDVGGGQSMFDLAFHIAGRPPGPEEAGRMANRGIIDWTGTGADSVSFQQVIAESDVKTKYTAALQALQAYVPPPRMIGGLLEKGGITEAQAKKYWAMGGVPPELTDAYVYESTQQATIQEKDLAKGQTITAYFDGIIDQTTAKELLHLLGYSGQVAQYMLDISDYRRELKALNTEVTRIGGYYMHHKITEVEAQSMLGTLGVPAGQIEGLLSIWSVDRIAPIRLPSTDQISKAVKYGTLSTGEALSKLEVLGYTPYDAAIVLSAEAEMQVKPLPAQTTTPPVPVV